MSTETRTERGVETEDDDGLVGWLRALADDDELDSMQAQTVEDAATEIEMLRASNARLLVALRPFAAFACDEPHVGEPPCHNCEARAAIAAATTYPRGETDARASSGGPE